MTHPTPRWMLIEAAVLLALMMTASWLVRG
jgi:hypothetical protein